MFHIKERDFSSLRDRHRRLRERIRQRDKEEATTSRPRSRQPSRTVSGDEEEDDRESVFTRSKNTPSRGAVLFRNRQENIEKERERERLIERLNRNRFETVGGSSQAESQAPARTRGQSFSSSSSVNSADREKEELLEKLNQFEREREELIRKLNQLENGEDVSVVEPVTIKPKKKLKPIVCRENNELHANPQSCRKYFKCENGLPSLQSCPANLIFDAGINVCNWPDATECIEDPDAILPTLGSSDHHPPSASIFKRPPAPNSFNNNHDFFSPAPTPAPAPVGRVPTLQEALDQEQRITAEYPYFREVLDTVKTLDNDEVEKISPNRRDNPDNVRRVEFILSEENFEDLFPRRHRSYTYTRLLQVRPQRHTSG